MAQQNGIEKPDLHALPTISDRTFPRIRGGDPALYDMGNGVTHFSPHTQGYHLISQKAL